MKVTVIEVVADGKDFNGNNERSMTVLGKFQVFRDVRTVTQKVVLTDEQYLKFKDVVGKQVDIEIIPPTVKYHFVLAV